MALHRYCFRKLSTTFFSTVYVIKEILLKTPNKEYVSAENELQHTFL